MKNIDKKKVLDIGIYILIVLGILIFITLVSSSNDVQKITDSYKNYNWATWIVYGNIVKETAKQISTRFSIFTYFSLIESFIQIAWSIVYIVYYSKKKEKNKKWHITLGGIGIITNTIMLSVICAIFNYHI